MLGSVVVTVIAGAGVSEGSVSFEGRGEYCSDVGVRAERDPESSVVSDSETRDTSAVGSGERCKEEGVGASDDSTVISKGDGGGDKEGKEGGSAISFGKSSETEDTEDGDCDLIEGTADGILKTLFSSSSCDDSSSEG